MITPGLIPQSPRPPDGPQDQPAPLQARVQRVNPRAREPDGRGEEGGSGGAGAGRARATPPRRPPGRPSGHVHGSPAVSEGQKGPASSVFENCTKNDFFGKINPGRNICTPLHHPNGVGGYMKGGEQSPLGDDNWVFTLDGRLQAGEATLPSVSGSRAP